MNKALGDVPVTVKLRTGVKDGKNTAHKLMPRLGPEWGTAAMTVRLLHLLTVNQLMDRVATWTYPPTTIRKIG